ncbi:hypothetical protein A2U01_0089006, partial [Trifolium medium]|nr:hypothetical protein [Trifolium medium]
MKIVNPELIDKVNEDEVAADTTNDDAIETEEINDENNSTDAEDQGQ